MDNQQTSNERWYYSQGEAVNGPFSLPELLQKAAEGLLNRETLVVPEGSEDWRPFSAIAPANTNSPVEKGATTETPPLPLQPEPEGAGNGSHEKDSPPKLRDKFFAAPAASSEKPAPSNKDALKGCGAFLLLLVAAVVLWHHWRFLLTMGGFLGVWYGFASSNLAAKRSKIYSIGGGLILGLLTMMLLRSCLGTDGIGSTAESVASNTKTPEAVGPIFQHEAAYSLKLLTEQFGKLESLVNLVNSDRPLPTTIDGYARLTTTKDIRKDAQYYLDMLSKRLAEVKRANKAANGYAKVVFEVESGLTILLLSVGDLETFVNDPSNRIQAARSMKNRLSTIRQSISAANEIYHEASKMAGIELVEAGEYKAWFDKVSQCADRFSELWKELDQSQASVDDTAKRLNTLRAEAKALCDSFDQWLSDVRQKENSITDVNQMDRLIQHDDLEGELSAIFTALESTIELDLSDDREDRIEVLGFMAQRIKDARKFR